MPTTTFGVRYPAASDPADVATDLAELASDADGIIGTIPFLTAKGDLITRTATTFVALPVGATDGHYLTADSTEADGLKWSAYTPANTTRVLLGEVSASGSGTSLSFSSIAATGTDLIAEFVLTFTNATPAFNSLVISVNGSTAPISSWTHGGNTTPTSYPNFAKGCSSESLTSSTRTYVTIRILNYDSASLMKPVLATAINATSSTNTGTRSSFSKGFGLIKSTAAVTSVSIANGSNDVIQATSRGLLWAIKRLGQ